MMVKKVAEYVSTFFIFLEEKAVAVSELLLTGNIGYEKKCLRILSLARQKKQGKTRPKCKLLRKFAYSCVSYRIRLIPAKKKAFSESIDFRKLT